NAPDQTVVGGTPEVLAQLAEQLTAARHKCQMLPVPCPFHTPLMEGVGPLLKRTLDTLRMRPPRVPMLSSITNRYVAEPDDIRANLAAQLTTPVRYVDLVERIVNEQDTVFVEVGPQQALTKLNRRILEKRSVAGVVACDNPKYPGLEPLYHVRALAECLGLVPSESRIAEKVQVGGASQPASVVGAVRPAAASQPPGKQPTEIANARSNTVDQSKPKRGTITHVDATERRIAKMRQKAADGGRTSNGKSGEPTAPSRAEPALPSGNGPAGASRISPAPQPAVSKPAAPAQVSRPAMPVTPAPPPAMSAPRAASPTRPIPAASHSGVANAAQAPPAASGLNAAELEKFLVNFVVEQTGYPPEVVELDADMEADLGIDSIKKAQLFGELAEYFDVQPGENLTLDDFPTLRHVMSFLVGASAKSSAVSNGAAASVAPAPARAVKAAASTRSMAPTAVPTPAPAATGGLNPAELEKFLVNFVVEQTGYPPEVVELDADMEADLGIDSIKKAQLFGELAEYFDVQPGENLTLDDFPTLRHVMNFLVGASAKSSVIGNGAAASMAPAPAPAARAAASTPSTAPAAVAIQAPAAAGGLNPAELEKFLVNFVVEQTGYPPEVVELDADMEADLGIDSIKKAQLFGELAEYFDVQPGENLTLDDFPTLRHVMNFLVGSDLKKKLAAGPSEPSSPCLTDPGPVCSPLAEAAQAEPELAAVATIAAQATPITSGELLILAGTRYEMGLAHGRHKKDEIRRILRRYADLAGAEIEELPLDARSLADPSRAFSSEELDELKGIAAGAGVLFSNIVAHNLAVAADFGNSTLQAAGAGGLDGAGGLLHVSSSDLPLLSALADCVEPVMQVRTPAGGIPHVALSVVGTCGSLGGVNAHGLAVTVGGHTTGPGGAARTGAHVLVAGNLLARADSIASAQTLAKSLPADSVWSAILSEAATGQMCAFECDGRTAAVHPNRDKQVLSATSQAGSQERLNAFASVLSSGASAHDAAERLMARWNPNADEARNEEAPRVDLIIDAARGQLWVGKSGRGFEQFLIRDLLRPPVVPLAPKVQPEVESPPFDLGTEEHYQTHRFCLRPRAMPFKPSVPEMPEWQGAALIVGQNEMSRALRRLLESAGVVVRELPETDDVDAAVAALEQIWREQAVPHLFITTGRDEESGDRSDVDVWNRRWRRVALVPYFLCQKWVQLAGSANMLDRTTLVATTRLNGNFGFEGELLAPECGALTGLMKAIYIEVGWMRNNRNMLLKAIDAPDDEPVDQLAANICRELASKTVDYEVAFVRGQRFLQYAYPQPAPT
ncbi:MAG TPA: phosphopantetheine-binding protein, partial [Pirellulales bacterium]|nr:phosphopantetheine-binding protein [Pirellulales bacterium]